MKNTRKCAFLFVTVISSILSQAQIVRPAGLSSQPDYEGWVLGRSNAARMLQTSDSTRDARRGVAVYDSLARAGDAISMNAMGVVLLKGMGRTVDTAAGIRWLRQSADSGYRSAWYNLVEVYKLGVGVKQNFKEAYRYASLGSARGINKATYLKGFFLYKGLSCRQDYEGAVKLFRASLHNGYGPAGSIYMLGLCYRNGYGVRRNLDSARYWLRSAAKIGFRNALQELAIKTPEYTNVVAPELAAFGKVAAESASSQTFAAEPLGTYTGRYVTFDWSGKKVVRRTPFSLTVTQVGGQGGQLSGIITRGSATTPWTGYRSGSTLIIESGVIATSDHYYGSSLLHLKLDGTALTLAHGKGTDSTYLLGKVSPWSVEGNEPEKPGAIVLSRPSGKESTSSAVLRFTAFPNPFSSTLSVSFNLRNAGSVSVELVALDRNLTVYRGAPQRLAAGNQALSVPVVSNLASGIYILVLRAGGKRFSTTVIKN